MDFVIAIVGRPNVGKSRLFNRLTSDHRAIVHDEPGVTRDRQYGTGSVDGRRFTAIDTGGLVARPDDNLVERMHDQVDVALAEADAVVLMMDGRAGLRPGDREITERLRGSDKSVYFAVNKVDQRDMEHEALADFYELGVDLYPISAEHDLGVDALMDEVTGHLEPSSDEEVESVPDSDVRCAVVGKPNAGKSTLVNMLLGEERVVTNEQPGTTRDAVDSRLRRGDRTYALVDTAGMRKKGNVSERLEKMAVGKAIRGLEVADVAVMVIEAPEGVTHQDKKIVEVIEDRGCACVLVVNKWDLLDRYEATGDLYRQYLADELPFLDWAPTLFTSAKTGRRIHEVLDAVDLAFDSYNKRVETSTLNDFLEDVTARHSPPNYKGRVVKFFYGTQAATRPPEFVFFVNRPEGIRDDYRGYLANELREQFGFEGTPIRILIRGRGGDE